MLKKLPPSVIALLLQCAAFAITLLVVSVAGLHRPPLLLALLCGLLAATFSYLSGLAKWWLLIQLLFAPALVLTLQSGLPPNFFLGAF
ncbi:MAG: class I SAM-dependent methyltransferase, partial [Nitrosomonadales bacterium]|nr:class I SAM-dependent methyltransferase [Nitrosomonadales bacterium]